MNAIPQALQNATARQAQAERERQARVILGSAEAAIAGTFVEAADTRRLFWGAAASGDEHRLRDHQEKRRHRPVAEFDGRQPQSIGEDSGAGE